MNIYSGFFMGEYIAYAAASALANQSSNQYAAQNADSMQNAAPSFRGLQNAIRPTVHQRDRWMREDLGIPGVSEDTQ